MRREADTQALKLRLGALGHVAEQPCRVFKLLTHPCREYRQAIV
jgi:hypothetical protein